MNKVNAPTPDFPHLFLGHKHTHTNIIPVQGLSMNAKGGDEGQNFALHIIFFTPDKQYCRILARKWAFA
jgi:hypothetical protein